MKSYVLKHCKDWLRFARSKRDLDIHLEDLMLVTGMDTVPNWAIMVFFQGNGEEKATFAVEAAKSGEADATRPEGMVWGKWSQAPLNRNTAHRRGPTLQSGTDRAQQADPPGVQYIFLRGCRVSKSKSIMKPDIIVSMHAITHASAPSPKSAREDTKASGDQSAQVSR
jgi:hypothetical protein